MSLIKCPECSREISDRAAMCPHCAYPMAPSRTPSVEVATARGKAVTTEATGKTYKRLYLVGGVLIVIGFLALFGGGENNFEIGLSAMGIGLWVILGARTAAWWHHG